MHGTWCGGLDFKELNPHMEHSYVGYVCVEHRNESRQFVGEVDKLHIPMAKIGRITLEELMLVGIWGNIVILKISLELGIIKTDGDSMLKVIKQLVNMLGQ